MESMINNPENPQVADGFNYPLDESIESGESFDEGISKLSVREVPNELLKIFEKEWKSTPGLVNQHKRVNKSSSTDNLLAVYINEIAESPLLTKDGERVLAQYIEEGLQAEENSEELWRSVWAKDKLIKSNMRLVVNIAKRYPRFDTSAALLDLIQEGAIGLDRAASKFDWRKGFKFSTYATWWIKQSVGRYLAKESQIKIPIQKVDQVRVLMNLESSLNASGVEVTPKRLAEGLGITRKELDRLQTVRQMLSVVSLDHTVSVKGAGVTTDSTLGEFVGSDDLGYDIVEDRFAANAVVKILSHLDERAREVMERRFGLNGFTPHTLEEIAQVHGITRERVRQIEQRAIHSLRAVEDIGDYEELLS